VSCSLSFEFKRRLLANVGNFFALVMLASCSAEEAITNLEPIAKGGGYQTEYRSKTTLEDFKIKPVSMSEYNTCVSQPPKTSSPKPLQDEERLSPGDLVDIVIGSDETLSGKYEVSVDGQIKVRGLASVVAFDRNVTNVEQQISKALVTAKYYDIAPPVSVRLSDYGVARVFVSGAVFESSSVTLGGSAASINNDSTREQAIGAYTDSRRLSRALQHAGGVRPDADLSRVVLKRGHRRKIVDLRPAITGEPFTDDLLIAGDQIEVPSRGCFQSELVRPSEISPVGVKVFMSNLTEPATSNANSAINKDTREMQYGTRFLQTIVSMNCVGGSKLTNASRSAVLFSRNPVTGKSVVIERNIEDLLRNADRDDYDPYILPNDALACYDSRTTDVFKVAQGFGIVASSIILGRGL
jgi:polysaccharide biosynthesis/export protein